MLVVLTMPRMGEQMQSGAITKIYLTEGTALAQGAKLLDVRVDLSALADQDCPPTFTFRMVARERGWVRKLAVVAGETREVGSVLAFLSTEPDEPIDGPAARPFRIASAAILSQPDWLAK